MILDSGVLSVFRKTDVSAPGEKPSPVYTLIGQSWYGELSFATSPSRPTEGRQELKMDARVRILQDRSIRQNDVAVLYALTEFNDHDPALTVYRIIRCYHGQDDSGPTQITDLSLEIIQP